MIPHLPCTYSTISASDLLAKVLPGFCIDKPIKCLFWQRGANDIYQVHTAEALYYLRLYRSNAYPREACEFEVEALNYLHNKNCPVAYPIAQKSGGYLAEIQAPEGPRLALLCAEAKGVVPDYKSLSDCQKVGESVAQFHLASQDFTTDWQRPKLDLRGLLDEPMNTIRTHLERHPKELKILESIATELRAAVQSAPESSLDIGVVHGDLHGGNSHIHEGLVTHFDFEECAIGYRVYDIGTLKWGCAANNSEGWSAILQGYEAVKPLTDVERSLINTFVLLREISEIAYGIRHVDYFGHGDIMATDAGDMSSRLKRIQKQLG
ncbi:MAG: phosphotransferase [Gammaproteobacteria bacterium]|nr:phosphotransferase [Gammaproteobacteria bacterium]